MSGSWPVGMFDGDDSMWGVRLKSFLNLTLIASCVGLLFSLRITSLNAAVVGAVLNGIDNVTTFSRIPGSRYWSRARGLTDIVMLSTKATLKLWARRRLREITIMVNAISEPCVRPYQANAFFTNVNGDAGRVVEGTFQLGFSGTFGRRLDGVVCTQSERSRTSSGSYE